MSVLHFWNDLSVLIALIGELIRDVTNGIISPVAYSYNFLRGFVAEASGTTTATTTTVVENTFSTTSTTSVMGVFYDLPFWNTLTTILGVAILIVGGIAIIKLLARL